MPQAVRFDQYGGRDVLRVVDVERPVPGPGEVLVKVRGGTEAYLAWSPTALPKGTTVLVIESRGNRTVDVSEWTDPLDPFPSGALPE